MKYKALIWIAFLFSGSLAAQTRFDVSASSDRIMIGDQVKIQLRADVAQKDNLTWPSLPDSIASGLLVGRSGIDTAFTKDRMTLTETWTVTSFDSGFAVVPPVTLTVNDLAYNSDPVLIQIDMPASEQVYRDIVEPRGLSVPAWKIVVTGLIALALTLIIFRIIRKVNRKAESDPSAFDVRPYHIRILETLEKLRDQTDLQSDDQVDAFYRKCSSLLYNYLQVGLNINTAKGRPVDWVPALEHHNSFRGVATDLPKLLDDANSVRFGNNKRSAEDHQRWFEQLKEWIIQSHSGTDNLSDKTDS